MPILKLIGQLQTFLWLILGRFQNFLKNGILIFLNIFLHISKTNKEIVMIFSEIKLNRVMNILCDFYTNRPTLAPLMAIFVRQCKFMLFTM